MLIFFNFVVPWKCSYNMHYLITTYLSTETFAPVKVHCFYNKYFSNVYIKFEVDIS